MLFEPSNLVYSSAIILFNTLLTHTVDRKHGSRITKAMNLFQVTCMTYAVFEHGCS